MLTDGRVLDGDGPREPSYCGAIGCRSEEGVQVVEVPGYGSRALCWRCRSRLEEHLDRLVDDLILQGGVPP